MTVSPFHRLVYRRIEGKPSKRFIMNKTSVLCDQFLTNKCMRYYCESGDGAHGRGSLIVAVTTKRKNLSFFQKRFWKRSAKTTNISRFSSWISENLAFCFDLNNNLSTTHKKLTWLVRPTDDSLLSVARTDCFHTWSECFKTPQSNLYLQQFWSKLSPFQWPRYQLLFIHSLRSNRPSENGVKKAAVAEKNY